MILEGKVGTELFEALRAADERTPKALATFDRVAASNDLRPDFFEHSVRISGASPYRLTYYFDSHRRGGSVARDVGARFAVMCAELALSVPPRLADFVQSGATSADEVLQVVLGIDAAADGVAVRCKYYLVFRGNPGRCVRGLMASQDLEVPANADPDKTYIVGVDVTSGGVEDIKLYFRLDRAAASRYVESSGDAGGLLALTRDVVFQQCVVRRARRQMYFHASSSDALTRWLSARGYDEALRRGAALDGHLGASRLAPWIVSFAYADRRLDRQAGTLYFHLAARHGPST